MKTRDKYSYFVDSKKASINALGLMSGTSLDGVDIALIKTDAETRIILKNTITYPYKKSLINNIQKFIDTREGIKNTNYLLTKFHADCILSFIKTNNISDHDIDIVGFHGQTIYHSPN
jgi:anhydro-N-acetylmuramic acid kinase